MENETGIHSRSEIAPEHKWRLEDIYASLELWERDFRKATEMVVSMPEIEKKLGPSPESILGTLQAVYALDVLLTKLFTFARMRRDEDSREALPQAMVDRTETLIARASAAGAFLRPGLLSMPENLLRDCMEDPKFSEYDRVLANILRNRPHTLPVEQEALLADAGEIGNAPDTIYTLFSEADLTFPKITGEDGQPTVVNDARLLTYLASQDRRVRQEAYETVLSTYGKYGNSIAAMYSASVKNDVFVARTRKFGSSIEASMFANEIPIAVYSALLDAINERLPALNRYLAVKKRMLKLDTLHMWDLYVDTAKEFKLTLSYDEAYALVLAALAPMGEAYTEVIRKAKSEQWIDVYENEGKHRGAYSWGCYGVHPYVLLNFEGTLDSASTLAHELGHAMHSHASFAAQPYAKAEYTLFAAEVASTVNEILLNCYLLDQHPERAAQQSLLGTLLEHYRTTVFRQSLFAEFERETHAMQERGEPLTREALCGLYCQINEKYYGQACEVDDVVRNEWMRISHFYRAFYVYQYATGFSAAVCIARKILREGQPAVDGYKRFLSAGGAMPPIEALRLAGVDMETAGPVREALDWFEEMLAQYERTID